MIWKKSFKLCQQYFVLYSKVIKISLNEDVYNLQETRDCTTGKMVNKSNREMGKAIQNL